MATSWQDIKPRHRRFTVALLAGLLASGLNLGPSEADAEWFYKRTNLVSDIPGKAKIADPNLIGAWGITHSSTSPWWVNSTQGGASLALDGAGRPVPAANPLVVNIPAPLGQAGHPTPTGIVANTSGFEVSPGNPSLFLFVTLAGTLSGWNPNVDPVNAVIRVDNSGRAGYTGATLAQRDGQNLLYVANFGEGRIDVFDANFIPVTLSSEAFTDPQVPSAFAPFNIQAINGALYVTYASKNVFQKFGGPNQGYVSVYDANGALTLRLRHGRWMNAPWGLALAPDGFGKFSHRLLVGMFGSGQIAGFDTRTGNFRGLLKATNGNTLTIAKGLWGLGFGSGNDNSGPADTLYFASDLVLRGGIHGVFGSLKAKWLVPPTPPAPTPTSTGSGY